MRWSLRARQSGRTFPWADADFAVPFAFLVQFGGLELASRTAPSPYGSPGSYLLLLLSTLLPLYFYPRVRRDGVGAIPPLPASVGLVGTVTVVSALYVVRVDSFSVVNSGVLGVAAVALAWTTVRRDVFADTGSAVQ